MSACSRWCELRTQTVDRVVSSQTADMILPRQALDKRVRRGLQTFVLGIAGPTRTSARSRRQEAPTLPSAKSTQGRTKGKDKEGQIEVMDVAEMIADADDL